MFKFSLLLLCVIFWFVSLTMWLISLVFIIFKKEYSTVLTVMFIGSFILMQVITFPITILSST